ncbi:YifB family Mg chelatase-like AAA ATPase [Tessaracoccus terricola]
MALSGIEGAIVEVETALGGGLPRVKVVGLPDASLNEAKERVKAAMVASGYGFPQVLLTINLSPAGLPKHGTHFDLAIAAATLACTAKLPAEKVKRFVYLGELSLNGKVRRVRGILPALLAASRAGFDKAVVPAGQVGEANLVPGLEIWPVAHLRDLEDVVSGRGPQLDEAGADTRSHPEDRPHDLADVHGHADGRWVMEVAAAGRHHVYLHGSPGVGKTMLAERLPGILPELSAQEAIEVSAVHSLAGVDLGSRLLTRAPYADPHHNCTMASLIGGGREIRPGSISLAHRGVLFLDEAPEFGAKLLDSLRTPLEKGEVTIARANQQVRYPARFQLVLAANPCSCGNSGVVGRECTCLPMQVRRYQERLSGPILDRIDIRHQMLPLKRAFLGDTVEKPESSAAVLQRVLEARGRQAARLRDTPWSTNGEVPGSYLRKRLPLPADLGPLERALARGTLSHRGLDKVLRLAWTVADLSGRDTLSPANLRVAMQMRQGAVLEAV